MTCYHPLSAYQLSDGSITFNAAKCGIGLPLSLPCGRCIGCRLDRTRGWAVRCVHEASLHKFNSFITLTYSPEHLPPHGFLSKRDFQLFFKRFRKAVAPLRVRFFACGEYGSKLLRPHYHAIIFGYDFSSDRYFWRSSKSGDALFRSPLLETLWPYGHSEIGSVSWQSASYVARYVFKKVNGDRAEAHYERICPDTGQVVSLPPEFVLMSRRPGIGYDWFQNYGLTDVYPHDRVIWRGKEFRPPKYYDKLLKAVSPAVYDEVLGTRQEFISSSLDNSTRERLNVREAVKQASLSKLIRPLEI